MCGPCDRCVGVAIERHVHQVVGLSGLHGSISADLCMCYGYRNFVFF